MRIARRMLVVFLVVALICAIAVSALAYYTVRRPLPKQEGEIAVGGARDAITIYRDSWGVPHIYAATPYDLFFAQGFVHAQDRWLQMDVSRHMARGTLSALLGENEDVQNADRLVRTLGWEQIAAADWAASSSESRAVLRAYAAGVNAYIAGRSPGQLALEYTVLDLRRDDIAIDPWTPLDTLAWLVALHWQQSGNAAQELENARTLTRVGETMLALTAPLETDPSAPTIIRPADMPLPAPEELSAAPQGVSPAIDTTRLPLDDVLAAFDLIGPRALPDGSGWVVSGARTASGRPLLAAAPGLPVQMPSAWYEVGLYCVETSPLCAYNVTGFSVPGVPAVFAGHNERIAWGFTGAGIDEQDTYVIRLNPDHPAQYAWEGGWRDLEVSEDALAINGADDPVPFIRYRTHLGPVIPVPSPLLERDQALVVRWAAQDAPSDAVLALLRLDRAQNWEDFRAALGGWGGAAANVLYADVDGNIGYQLAGRIPVRGRGHSGMLPDSGEDGAAAWGGYLPFDALPSLYNPPRGYIIAAGNPILPSGYEESFTAQGTVWDPGYRAARIEERLLETEAHTVETFADIQGDTASAFADRLLPYLARLAPDDTMPGDMLAWLGEWDRRYTMDSPQAALFGSFWQRLVEFTYADELGVIPCDCNTTRQAILSLLAVPTHPWWDDVQTRFVVERRDAILRKAFEQAVIDLTGQFGEDRAEWRWGDLHTATFTGVLALNLGVELIEDQFSQGPVPVSGSADTINATRSATSASHPFRVLSAPSARLIVDLGDLENSRAMHTTGQSNHLASPHDDDMIDPWRFVEYHNMLWTHTTIEESADAMLSLEPVFPPDDTPESGSQTGEAP